MAKGHEECVTKGHEECVTGVRGGGYLTGVRRGWCLCHGHGRQGRDTVQ